MRDLRTMTIHEKSGQSGDFALEDLLAFEVLKALPEHVMTFFQPEQSHPKHDRPKTCVYWEISSCWQWPFC